MSQTSYPTAMSAGIAGQPYDARPLEVVTRTLNNGAAIPFGVAVARQADGKVKLPDASNNFIVGVAIFDQSRENRSLSSDLAIAEDGPMNVCRKGALWVVVQDACTEGGAVYVRHGGTGQAGGFLGTDDAGNSSLLAGARWLTTQATEGGLAVLEFDLVGLGSMS